MRGGISWRGASAITQTVTLFVVLFVFSSCTMKATLTPYEIPGTIAEYEANYYWILGIQAGETVLLNIVPDFSDFYDSQILYANLTQVRAISAFGGHAYDFIAEETGDYILKIWGSSGFDYTIKSSHEIPNGEISHTTPYTAIGEIQAYETAWHIIYGVKKSEILFISVIPESSTFFSSELCYPNLTRIDYKYTSGGGHARERISDEDGNFIFKVWGTHALNYTIKCSNYATSEPPIPDFSLVTESETLIIEIGSSRNATVTVQSHLGYTSDITLNATSLPAGISAVLNPILVTLLPNDRVNSTLTISADLTVEQGTAPIYIIGKSGNLTRLCRIRLTVQEVQNKLPSSISCYLNATQMSYTENVFISAKIEPPLATGKISIETTKDNVTWSKLILKVPSDGQCDLIWNPEAGTHFIRAKWSGDYNHLPCESQMQKLVVDKKSTTLTITLSANIAYSGQYVTARATIHPHVSTQTIIIQCSTSDENWLGLASGLTDDSGSFTHTWLPEGSRLFWLRSTWSGTENYLGNSSKPVILILEVGNPAIATHIEMENTTLTAEWKEDAVAAYTVMDETSSIIERNSETLNTLSLGTFDIWIIFFGNETHKSCFYNTSYKVTSIATKIENVEIVSEYSPNPVELILEYFLGASSENKTYSGCSAYVKFDVCKAKCGDLILRGSLKLDTSTIGYSQIDLMYDGNETYGAAVGTPFRYKVLERIPLGTAVEVTVAIVVPIATLMIGWRTGLWRNWWKKLRKREKKAKKKVNLPQEEKKAKMHACIRLVHSKG